MASLNVEESISYNQGQGFSAQEIGDIQLLFGVSPSRQWDAPTVEALAEWQRKAEIAPDGKLWRNNCGNTWPKLRASIRGHQLADLISLFHSAGLSVRDERVAPRPWTFTPVGVVIHHTATAGAEDLPTLKIAREGRPGLSGPLCQVLLGRQGTVAVIAEGLANHAGMGRAGVLRQVKAGARFCVNGEADSVGGNQWFYGIEIENDGRGEVFPRVQYTAALATAAALCKHFGWREQKVIGHKEWTSRKVDPHFDMDEFRAALATELSRPEAEPPSV